MFPRGHSQVRAELKSVQLLGQCSSDHTTVQEIGTERWVSKSG